MVTHALSVSSPLYATSQSPLTTLMKQEGIRSVNGVSSMSGIVLQEVANLLDNYSHASLRKDNFRLLTLHLLKSLVKRKFELMNNTVPAAVVHGNAMVSNALDQLFAREQQAWQTLKTLQIRRYVDCMLKILVCI